MDKLKETTQLLQLLLEAYFIAQRFGHPKINRKFRFTKLSNKHLLALLYAIREYANEFSVLLPVLDNTKKNMLFYSLVSVFEEMLKTHKLLMPEKDLLIIQSKEVVYEGPTADIGELEEQVSEQLTIYEPEEDDTAKEG